MNEETSIRTINEEYIINLFNDESFYNLEIKPLISRIIDNIFEINSEFEIMLINEINLKYNSYEDRYYLSPIDIYNKSFELLDIDITFPSSYDFLKYEDFKIILKKIIKSKIKEIVGESSLDDRNIYEYILPKLKMLYVKSDDIFNLDSSSIDRKIKKNLNKSINMLQLKRK